MIDVPADLLTRLRTHGQDHLLLGWERLSAERGREFVRQLSAIDFAQLTALVNKARQPKAAAKSQQLAPLPVTRAYASGHEQQFGEGTLRAGEVAALIVAGGQGSRLGFEKPKGMYGVGPV